jgi:hypothetical protein
MEMQIRYADFELRTENKIPVGKKGKKQHISLGICNPLIEYREVAEYLFTQFGTMHMVSALLPSRITLLNYKLSVPVKNFIRKMYMVSRKPTPKIISISGNVPGAEDIDNLPHLDDNHVVIPFSGGKDSTYHFLDAMKKDKSPYLVHIQNLNPSCCSEEVGYAKKYAKWKNVPLDVLKLKNGTPRNGFEVMRDRDMFLVSLMIPYALQYRARNIMIEGFQDESAYDLFSGKEKYMKQFNFLLNKLGFDVNIVWDDMEEWKVLELMIREYPKDLVHTNSCFSYPLLKKQMRRNVLPEKYPGFPFFESQCGICFKCFMINLARIAFDEKLKCPKETLKAYMRRADKWIARKIKMGGEMYKDPSLLYLLRLAQEKVGL